tara:strand:- start:578 stop:1867 length:1290 start_codon:yes stop_codon:yes gene_type:complete
MQLLTIGLNHLTAPLRIREKVAFPSDQIGMAVSSAITWFKNSNKSIYFPETAIISTCNRTEIYEARNNAIDKNQAIISAGKFLSNYHKVSFDELKPHLYVLPQHRAVRHAFRVASGLDSMILGEPQILGQMKHAINQADAVGGLGTYLHQMFQKSFSIAKEVRSSTEIGSHSISMASTAVSLSSKIFQSLENQNILFIGAGEMIDLCATHFASQNPKSLTVANRNLEKAKLIAKRINAKTLSLADISYNLAKFDIVITCTASSLPIIGLGMVERAIKIRRRKPIFMVDLAVPRDIEFEVSKLNDIFLYTIDDLSSVIRNNLKNRKSAVNDAEEIIDSGVKSFMNWFDTRKNVPFIQDLRESSDLIRKIELDRAKKLLNKGEEVEKVLESLSKGLTSKFLHGPHLAINNADKTEKDEIIKILSKIFPLKR